MITDKTPNAQLLDYLLEFALWNITEIRRDMPYVPLWELQNQEWRMEDCTETIIRPLHT